MASTYPVLAQRFRRAGTIAVPVADLAEILPIPDPDEPFEGNRRVNVAHADGFGQYWVRSSTWVVPPILVDTDHDLGRWFTPSAELGVLPEGFSVGTLALPRPSRSGLQILDGQHRVLGWMRLGVELTEALSATPERAEFAARALERMGQDRVTIEIVEALELDAHKQYFFDIAANALGISVSLASSFDRSDPIRLAAQALADEHPLLEGRVEIEKDRTLAGSTSLISLKNVVDVVDAAVGGTRGAPTGEARRALDLSRVTDVAGAALDALLDEFSGLGDIVEGEVTPAELRADSLLGSVTVWRALVTAFHEIAVRDGVVDPEGDRRARAAFRSLSPQMGFPIADCWWTSGAFADQTSRSPGARRQDVEALVAVVVGIAAGSTAAILVPIPTPIPTTAPAVTPSAAAPAVAPEENEDDDAAAEPDDLDRLAAGLDLVSLYLNQAAREPLLTAEEEVELATQIEVGLFARERLEADPDHPDAADLLTLVEVGEAAHERFICANLRLVNSVAWSWGAREVDVLDRIQAGNLGLMRAVERFDFRAGNKFSTYGTWWIRQSISRSAADEARTIRLPVYVVDAISAVEKRRRELERNGRDVTDAELAAACEVTVSKVVELRALAHPVGSLDELLEETDDAVVPRWQRHPDVTCSGSGSDGLGEVLESDFARLWQELMFTLGPREQTIVWHRFGLDGDKPWTLEELGVKVRLTRERVRQLEKKAMEVLRTEPYVWERLRGIRDVGWESSG